MQAYLWQRFIHPPNILSVIKRVRTHCGSFRIFYLSKLCKIALRWGSTRGISDVAGGYLIYGGANVRDLRKRRWRLPTTGPKTLNGLILGALESIPEAGTALRIGGYTIEIMQTTDHAAKTARVTPPAESR